MATKREIQRQIEELNKAMETAEDDEDYVEVFRVKKSHLPWLFQSDDPAEGEPEPSEDGKGNPGDDGKSDEKPKDEPKPKPRTKYFG